MITMESKGIHLVKIDATKAHVVAVSGGERSLSIDGERKYDPENGTLFIRPNDEGVINVRMPRAMKVMARINEGTVRIADMNTVQVNSVNANISVYRCGNVHIRNKTGQTIIDSCTKRLRISNGSGLLNITDSIPQDTIADSESGGIAVIISGHMMDSLVSLITGTGSIRMIMDNPSSLTLLTRIGYGGTAKPDGIIIRSIGGDIMFSLKDDMP